VVNAVSPTSSSSNATGGDPLHGPVSVPHISVRTDDTPRTRVYFIVHTGMANARVPPLAPSRNGSPGLPRPPDAGRGFFIPARDDRSSIAPRVGIAVQGEPSNAAMLDLCIKCEWATLGRGCFRARRLSCAQSRSQQSCSLLFGFPVGRALTVRGARITSSTRIAVSIRMSNVRPHVQETADFARKMHSQRMALRGNRKGVFGATISKPDCPISKPQTARPMQGFPMH
jgi:hypothetical protein